MAEKFTYGPLIYNFIGDDDTSGNYWWPGNPPVAYEQESGVFRIPVDADGNQCLPGECILHPNCRVGEWDEHPTLGLIPNRDWCRQWFEDNFLIIPERELCKYIIRWYWWNHRREKQWIDFSKDKRVGGMIADIWPGVMTSLKP